MSLTSSIERPRMTAVSANESSGGALRPNAYRQGLRSSVLAPGEHGENLAPLTFSTLYVSYFHRVDVAPRGFCWGRAFTAALLQLSLGSKRSKRDKEYKNVVRVVGVGSTRS